MTSSMLAGEKRWASSTRRGGMTVLGKVAVPKPLNLPNQRLENHGLDPSVEIVPKGTLSWGSRSSSSASNAWGSSALSPNTDGGTSSPSYLSGRPSSGGGTRPSTAGSDRMHEPTPNAWGQNSRPSSASGVLTSNQTALASRPRSAETRPGSSQLSRFAEPSSDNSVAWGPTGVSEKLNSSSMDYIDSVRVTREKVGMEFVSEINQTIKEHFENLLHVVDGLSARLSQLESKTHQLENAVDDLKVSAEYNSGRTDGKLRQLENILREVKVNRLRSLEHEREIMGFGIETVDGHIKNIVDVGVDNEGGDEAFVDGEHVVNVKVHSGNKREDHSTGKVCGTSVGGCGVGTDGVRDTTIAFDNVGKKDAKLGEALQTIVALVLQNKTRDDMISLLQGEITKVKQKSELQIVNIVGGFGCVLKMKNEELEKLRKKNEKLQKTVTVLEEQLADRDVHDVTQPFCNVSDGQIVGGISTSGCGFSGTFLCDVEPLRAVDHRECNTSRGDVEAVKEFIEIHVHDRSDVKLYDSEIEIVPFVEKGVPGLGVQNSFVHNIKNKVRKE